jgi:hypothetical protein
MPWNACFSSYPPDTLLAMQRFDLVLTNPPFQDTANRGKTRHKLWIDFTERVFEQYLAPGGILCQVSPSSFRSPSNRILSLIKRYRTYWIDFDCGEYFPEVASTFSHYAIQKVCDSEERTIYIGDRTQQEVVLGEDLFYLPNDHAPEAVGVHQKVIFQSRPKLPVRWDYVTCHNVLLKRSSTLSKSQTDLHVYPVFHTNRQIWWSSIRQDWAGAKKVMWSRSGYTLPFYDAGRLGGTDLAYFVLVDSDEAGRNLAHNMNLLLMRYVYATARWSGFGNERVFAALPVLPTDRALSDEECFSLFGLTPEEVSHVTGYLGANRAADE